MSRRISGRKLVRGEVKLLGPSASAAMSTMPVESDVLSVTAVIATLSEVDSDNDTYSPGAFANNDAVLMSAWQHGSWSANILPIGLGSIVEKGDQAIFSGRFLATSNAREHFLVLQALKTLIQWSYGYDVIRSRPIERAGRPVRELQKLRVFEVSPVLTGAGVGTSTIETSGLDPETVELGKELARTLQLGRQYAAAGRAEEAASLLSVVERYAPLLGQMDDDEDEKLAMVAIREKLIFEQLTKR